MKSLILTACVLACTVGSANAQCIYRMNDVGRGHGYLSGPCNGAAQNYSGAYPNKQRVSAPPSRSAIDRKARPRPEGATVSRR
jgi:hypothetical protein